MWVFCFLSFIMVNFLFDNFFDDVNLNGLVYNIIFEEGCFDCNSMVIWVIRVVVYCVIILVLVLGNIMIIMVVWCNRMMWKFFYCFIVNLVVIDLIIILVYMLWFIVMWLRGSEWLVEDMFGLVLCKFVLYLYGVGILVLIFMLMILVIDRFFVIVFFLK